MFYFWIQDLDQMFSVHCVLADIMSLVDNTVQLNTTTGFALSFSHFSRSSIFMGSDLNFDPFFEMQSFISIKSI